VFERMGDARHKKTPPIDEEDVTPRFRDLVLAQLEANRKTNERNGIGRRDPSRLIDDRASLARAVGTDTTQINNILGPVRSSSKPKKLVDRSAFVRPIQRALHIESTVMIEVPEADAARVRKLLSVDRVSAELFEGMLDKLIRR